MLVWSSVLSFTTVLQVAQAYPKPGHPQFPRNLNRSFLNVTQQSHVMIGGGMLRDRSRYIYLRWKRGCESVGYGAFGIRRNRPCPHPSFLWVGTIAAYHSGVSGGGFGLRVYPTQDAYTVPNLLTPVIGFALWDKMDRFLTARYLYHATFCSARRLLITS